MLAALPGEEPRPPEPAGKPRVLIVDDEEFVLAGLRRILRDEYDVATALNSGEALRQVEAGPPFAAVIADMRMPVGMNGAQLLGKLKQIAPLTQRVMLTGLLDQDTAAQAINQGTVFRFLTKPVDSGWLYDTLQAAVRQYQIEVAEDRLLEDTLIGAVRVLLELLESTHPAVFGRASRVREIARLLAAELNVANTWQIELASMLSQIGTITIPEATLRRAVSGHSATREDVQHYEDHPRLGSQLVSRIPRLGNVADIIALQQKHYDGSGSPEDDRRRGEQIPLGARILKCALDYEGLMSRAFTPFGAVTRMHERAGWYDPNLVNALSRVGHLASLTPTVELPLRELRVGMTLAKDVIGLDGELLASRNQTVSTTLWLRLDAMSEYLGEDFTVTVVD
ncbi:MAG: response regulator [Dehalococcoidia bacterium]|nr:response regulator [Dehalococcoidia bacterium]